MRSIPIRGPVWFITVPAPFSGHGGFFSSVHGSVTVLDRGELIIIYQSVHWVHLLLVNMCTAIHLHLLSLIRGFLFVNG